MGFHLISFASSNNTQSRDTNQSMTHRLIMWREAEGKENRNSGRETELRPLGMVNKRCSKIGGS